MLNELLEKLGIKSYDGLTAAERDTYKQWSLILTRPDATIDDVKRFCAAEKERIDVELRNYENSPRKQLFYQVYSTLLASTSPSSSTVLRNNAKTSRPY